MILRQQNGNSTLSLTAFIITYIIRKSTHCVATLADVSSRLKSNGHKDKADTEENSPELIKFDWYAGFLFSNLTNTWNNFLQLLWQLWTLATPNSQQSWSGWIYRSGPCSILILFFILSRNPYPILFYSIVSLIEIWCGIALSWTSVQAKLADTLEVIYSLASSVVENAIWTLNWSSDKNGILKGAYFARDKLIGE